MIIEAQVIEAKNVDIAKQTFLDKVRTSLRSGSAEQQNDGGYQCLTAVMCFCVMSAFFAKIWFFFLSFSFFYIVPMHGSWCSRFFLNNIFSQLNKLPTHIVPMHKSWCSRSLLNNTPFQLNKCSTHTVLMHGNWCSRSFSNNTSSTYPNRTLSHVEASINLIL